MSNRTKFVTVLADRLGSSKKHANELLEVFTDVLRTQVKSEGEAVFPGFGRIKVQTRSARRGHNPKTGAPIDIPARTVLKFKSFPDALKE